MKVETAISLISLMMEALVHRKTCLRVAERDLPDELLAAALAKLEAAGRDTSGVREWLPAMVCIQRKMHKRLTVVALTTK